MTIDEFITELAAAKVRGFLVLSAVGTYAIRCNDDDHDCPISALAHARGHCPRDYFDAADGLGLCADDCNAIVAAADGAGSELRARLLTAVGLEEVTS